MNTPQSNPHYVSSNCMICVVLYSYTCLFRWYSVVNFESVSQNSVSSSVIYCDRPQAGNKTSKNFAYLQL